MSLTIKKIHLSEIHIPSKETGDGVRTRKIDDSIISLAGSIKTDGVLNLPKVKKSNPAITEKPYTISDGAGRCLAMGLISEETKQWEWDFVFDDETESVDPIESMIQSYIGNSQVKVTANKDYIDSLITIMQKKGWNVPELVNRFGGATSAKHIYDMLKTVNLPEKHRTALENGELSLGQAIELSKLVNKMDTDQFDNFVEDMKGKTVAETAQQIADFIVKDKEKKEQSEEGLAPVFVGIPTVRSMYDDMTNRLAFAEAGEAPQFTEFERGQYYQLQTIFSLDVDSVTRRNQEAADKLAKKEAAKMAKENAKKTESLEAAKERLLKEGYVVTPINNDN